MSMPSLFGAGRLAALEEFMPHLQAAGSQERPAIAELNSTLHAGADAGFVVTWISGSSLRGQIHDRHGDKVGTELTLAGNASQPAVAGLAAGGFVASWVETGPSGGLKARIFDASGEPAENVLDVAADGDHTQQQPSLAPLSGGGFAVAWTDGSTPASGIRLSLYDFGGIPVATSILVEADPVHSSYFPKVVALADGNVVVTWTGPGAGPDDPQSVNLRIFDGAGNPVTDALQVNAGSGDQWVQSIAVLDSGDFVVTWTDQSAGGLAVIKAQLFDPAGAKIGAEFQVNTVATGAAGQSSVAPADGGFLVTWYLDTDEGGPNFFQRGNIKGQLFDASGARVGDEFLVNESTELGQYEPALARFGSGDVAAVWTSFNPDASSDVAVRLFFGTTYGTEAADSLDAGTDRDVVYALGGDDFVQADDGDDHVSGGEGHDDLYGDGGDDLLSGDAGDDYLNGGAGVDTMAGGQGNDLYVVDHEGDVVTELSGEGTDTVESNVTHTLGANVENLVLTGSAAIDGTGNALANVLTGNAAANTLDGGDGLDTLIGGAGDDTYVYRFGDEIVELAGGGTDTVYTDRLYVMDEWVENAVITGTTSVKVFGNSLDNHIIGSDAKNVFEALAGADTMEGRGGDDTYLLESAGDVVIELADGGTDIVHNVVSYTLGNHVENLKLNGTDAIDGTGNGLANALTGNGMANVLDGRGGADRLEGYSGDDTYIVDQAGDVVIEHDEGGTDIVRSSVGFTLGANVENLVLTGTGAIDGTGNALANSLTGNAANNLLNGGLGADTMAGGAGDDTYVVDEAGDVVTETAGSGRDLVRSSVTFTLGANVEKLSLTGTAAIDGTGNGLNNFLVGNSGANVLNGLGGADAMAGGAGDDTYFADNVGDRVTENSGEGTDTVMSSVSFSLTSHVDNLVLTGTAGIDAIGNSQANSLTGNSAANLINGGGGVDVMAGAGGNDIYIVDNVGDAVTELSGAGTDLVKSSVTFTLGANVERLTLRGGAAIDGTGNDLGNIIAGNEAANRLDGGAGADKLMGAGGNDTYVVDHIADQVIEASSGGGSDTVLASVSFELGDHVESLWLTGAGPTTGTGNDLANFIFGQGTGDNILDGGRGNDALSAGAGDDELHGGLGFDSLEGGAGADDFVFDKPLGATNVDMILDFAAGTDRIVLENAVFQGLGAGAMDPNKLAIGAAAGDADDRIVYDPSTGNLYYDSDGSGAAAQVLFAGLDNPPPTLSASDFAVI